MRSTLLLLIFFGGQVWVSAQSSKEVFTWDFNGKDSVLRKSEGTWLDASGAKIKEEEKTYNLQNPGTPSSERTFFYNPAQKTATVTEARAGGTGKTFKKLYQSYSGDPSKDLVLRIRTYDGDGFMISEDTLRYDQQNRLVGKCTYGYTGGTSKNCELYAYNKKGFLKEKVTNYYWNTINRRGKVKERTEHMQRFRYGFDKKNNLVHVKFRHRFLKGDERIKFNSYNKRIHKDYKSRSWFKDKKTGKKVYYNDKAVTNYTDEGLMTDSTVWRNEKETHRTVIEYQKGLPKKSEVFRDGKLYQEVEWDYFPSGKPKAQRFVEYRDGKAIQTNLTEFNEYGDVTLKDSKVSDNQIFFEKNEYVYDVTKKLISRKVFNKTGLIFTTLNEYDPSGRPLQSINVRPDGGKITAIYYVYRP